ncbi:cytochrome P450 [Frankia sp. CNm7]|uniref:Cytochrome P450 n=1 Tax=Frankia nepalensis TaxID=1836974 RepID=A0A937ULT9_9ACTN|nr:cytochrome P450 [Frankia nepalensis]MBL7500801.1 cytochrome P450 [Frankia nepalensis]MBL7512608.1 cytochrome P450 [Frankia nepalensis]MBL7523048.1 cytochrome P450 [Frankia nepalensis]MBL7628199.1 cytochrome P450 [Frankia nepalensis]
MSAGPDVRYQDIDFFSDRSIVDDPYPYFAFLRAVQGPVWFEPHHGVAVVTGHAEAMDVYRDPDLFSSCNAPTGPFPGLPTVPDQDDAGPLIEQCREQLPMHEFMVTMDPPRHSEYRSLFTGLFTPGRLQKNEEFMWRLADVQLDNFVAKGRCEFVGEYAGPFAGLVIADLLGVPPEDMHRFREGFERQSMSLIGENPDLLAENPLEFIEGAFVSYIEDRRRRPRGDILTHLAERRFSNGSLPDVAILAREASFVFAAGQETTVRLMAFALRHLAEHPGVQDRIRAQRDLIPAFVEEMLRLESPIKSHFRLARRRTSLGGVEIPAGTTIMLLPGASNRDPRHFAEPDQFDLGRANVREHLAFGRGVHGCLGQPLARSETRVTLERVLDRMADIRLSDDAHGPADDRRFDYLPTFVFRALNAIHLNFEPV